ncbi:SET and MYND domain-containing protein 4-like isoform X1 [Cimex lectularius]|uniref:Protein-lysine N-methyltransferase SMYD4 n=1 Tax=Cimex lectularius TaxID=79782 RepID=A0A8I6TFP9_CIMLE|nr:SET and MYND domain-containing protein 4-like isoform X1 [Cimex lectularius]
MAPETPLERACVLFSTFVYDSKLEEQLTRAPSVGDMVAQFYQLMSLSGVFPKQNHPSKKSNNNSVASRTKGNRYYSEKDYMKALELYTRAVGEAQNNSAELALAYANRSAVTFCLEEYEDSIVDVERALSGKYPQMLRVKLLERKGRSLVFLRSYRKAVATFEEALQALEYSKIPNKQRSNFRTSIELEIAEIRDKCDDVINRVPAVMPKLTHPPSDCIECASNAVDIDYMPGMGRMVVAATDIYPGDVIAIERPYVSSVLAKEYLLFCYMCKKRCHSLIPCLNCPQVFFCNENCRNSSWNESHRVECDILLTLHKQGYNKLALLALHILLKMTNQGDGLREYVYNEHKLHSVKSPKLRGFKDGKYSCNKYSTYHLETNFGLRSWDDDTFSRVVGACCMLHVLKQTSYFDAVKESRDEKLLFRPNMYPDLTQVESIVGAILLKYLFIVSCNAHEVSETRIITKPEVSSEIAEIGAALYPFLSLINHSCDPNVVRTIHDGDLAVLTAIQFIKNGEQVFDNYGYHHGIHGVDLRQESLVRQYYFVCKCRACLEDWPTVKKLPECVYLEGVDKAAVEAATKQFQKEVTKVVNNNENYDLKFLYNFLGMLHNSVQRPCALYCKCQEVIKECLIRNANHYVFK